MRNVFLKKVVPQVLVIAVLAASAMTVKAGTLNGTLNVNATVQAQCLISSITDVAFGTYTQGSGSLNVLGAVRLNCGVGSGYSVALSGPTATNRFMMNAALDQLQYQLFSDAGRSAVWGSTSGTDTVDGVGTGAAEPLTIYATLFDNTANRAKPSGAYNAVVNITVTY